MAEESRDIVGLGGEQRRQGEVFVHRLQGLRRFEHHIGGVLDTSTSSVHRLRQAPVATRVELLDNRTIQRSIMRIKS